MNALMAAIRFLTILPAGGTDRFEPHKMIPFFPIVGLLIGLLLALFDALVGCFWSLSIASLLDGVFLIMITGALHLDGLGDTADGLYGHRPKEKALEIMKDSRIGAMGVTAIIVVLVVKWAGLMGMASHRSLGLILVPAYARGSMLFGFKLLPYCRSGGGTAHPFFQKPINWTAFIGFLPVLVFSFFLGWTFPWLLCGFAGVLSSLLFFYRSRMGCITGDMLGAMVEIAEAALFLLLAAEWNI